MIYNVFCFCLAIGLCCQLFISDAQWDGIGTDPDAKKRLENRQNSGLDVASAKTIMSHLLHDEENSKKTKKPKTDGNEERFMQVHKMQANFVPLVKYSKTVS